MLPYPQRLKIIWQRGSLIARQAALVFAPQFGDEFDAMPLATRLISAGWCASMAAAEQINAPLAFRDWFPGAPMGEDPYDIPIPLTLPVVAPDILLIPLVAFDKCGFRLGYGGGYFDRTPAKLSTRQPYPIAIGVGFSLGSVESVRAQSHDQPINYIVTENGIDKISHEQ